MEGRLIICKVVLENFKSYAGIKTIGPFHDSLSAVVGPNGSGKSNLLECLLFAFGKRAKKMRLNKLSELIHKSKVFPSLPYAKVSVYFENISETFPHIQVPGSSFTISRTVFRNNTSIYKINEEDSTYEELKNLLNSKKIDLEHNRFLILQGEVEQIALMKPKGCDESKSGLLEYLEEIIGSDKYVQDIVNKENELERVAEEMICCKIQLDQASTALNGLSEEMMQLTEFIYSQKQLSELNNLKFHIQLVKNSQNFNIKDAEFGALKQNLKDLEKQFDDDKVKDLQVVTEYEQKVSEIKIFQKQVNILYGQMQDILTKDQKNIKKIDEVKGKLKEISEEMLKEGKKSEEIEKLIRDIALKLPNNEERLQIIKDELLSVEKEFSKANELVVNKTGTFQKSKDILQRELNRYKQQHQTLKTEIDNYNKTKSAKIQFLDAQFSEVKNIEEQMSISNSHLSKVKANEEATLKTLNTKMKDLQRIKNSNKELQEELEECIKQLKIQKTLLYDIESDEKHLENTGKLYNEIINSRKNGKLNGIIGRLGDLGSIDSKYDVAVSSASYMFDFFVAKSVANAQGLIEFVRSNRLGKVNVLILEKINDVPDKTFKNPDLKAQRLFDLINILNPEVKKCFYLALKDTLVADTLEDCRKIAFGLPQRWRVVCRTGEVFNPTGEMLGYSKMIHGKVKLSNNSKIAETISKSTVLEEIRNLSEKRERLETELKSGEGESLMLEHQIKSMENEVSILKSEKNNINEKIKSFEIRIEILNKRKIEEGGMEPEKSLELIGQQEESILKLEKLMSLKSEEMHDIEVNIEKIGGEGFLEIKKKYLYLQKIEDEVNSDISKSKQKKIQLEIDLKIVQENQQACLKTKNVLEDSMQNIKLNAQKIEMEGKEIANLHKKVEETLEEKNKELEKLLLEKKKFNSVVIEFQNKHTILVQKLQDLHKELNFLQSRVHTYSQQIQNNRDKYKQDLLPILSESILEFNQTSRNTKEIESLLFDPLKDFSEEEVKPLTTKFELIEDQEKILIKKIENIAVDFTLLEKYRKRLKDFQLKTEKFNQIKTNEQIIKEKYQNFKIQRLSVFNKGFSEISVRLKEIYRLITNGGDADLELADSTDPFSEGIVFTVRPPAKAWKKMTNLSGGEKTLSSLALVFALHTYKPNALYVMDEIDAALDFMNVGIG